MSGLVNACTPAGGMTEVQEVQEEGRDTWIGGRQAAGGRRQAAATTATGRNRVNRGEREEAVDGLCEGWRRRAIVGVAPRLP